MNRKTGCPSHQHCNASLVCTDDKSPGSACLYADECSTPYCTLGRCVVCLDVNRNAGCPPHQHCSLQGFCVDDKEAGALCTHADECRSGACVFFRCAAGTTAAKFVPTATSSPSAGGASVTSGCHAVYTYADKAAGAAEVRSQGDFLLRVDDWTFTVDIDCPGGQLPHGHIWSRYVPAGPTRGFYLTLYNGYLVFEQFLCGSAAPGCHSGHGGIGKSTNELASKDVLPSGRHAVAMTRRGRRNTMFIDGELQCSAELSAECDTDYVDPPTGSRYSDPHILGAGYPYALRNATVYNCGSSRNDGQQALAVDGYVTAPMQRFVGELPSYVSWPNLGPGNSNRHFEADEQPGRVSFFFTAKSSTTVAFAFEVLALSGEDNSFFVQVPSSPQATPVLFSLSTGQAWAWQTPQASWTVAPGSHVLNVIAREDGARLSKVRLENGDAALDLDMGYNSTCSLMYCNSNASLQDEYCGGTVCNTTQQALTCMRHWMDNGKVHQWPDPTFPCEGLGLGPSPSPSPAAAGPRLNGTVFGSNAGTDGSGGGGYETVFDGDTASAMDVVPKGADWGVAGLDLRFPFYITGIRFFPRAQWEARMVGGRFQGSSASPGTGFVDMYSVSDVPSAGAWADVGVANAGPFRWVKYVAPAGSFGNVAEVQFLGTPFGVCEVGQGEPGASIGKLDSNSESACRSQCRSNPGCVAFDFTGVRRWDSCRLFGLPTPMLSNGGADHRLFCVMDCSETSVDYEGHDIANATGAARPEQCQAQCQADAQCSHWTFVDRAAGSGGAGVCRLKSSEVGRKSSMGHVSGPKHCPTCSDSIQNGDEARVDCGGSCPECRTVGYQQIPVTTNCPAMGLDALDDVTQCIEAAAELGLGVKSIATRHDTADRPAGCAIHVRSETGPQLEFNANAASTWTSSEWSHLHQICTRPLDDSIVKVDCELTADTSVTKVYVDGIDRTSSISGTPSHAPITKALSFWSSRTHGVLAIQASDSECGCACGGLAVKCTSASPQWQISSERPHGWKVWSTATDGASPPDVAGQSWYAPDYVAGSGFYTPRHSERHSHGGHAGFCGGAADTTERFWFFRFSQGGHRNRASDGLLEALGHAIAGGGLLSETGRFSGVGFDYRRRAGATRPLVVETQHGNGSWTEAWRLEGRAVMGNWTRAVIRFEATVQRVRFTGAVGRRLLMDGVPIANVELLAVADCGAPQQPNATFAACPTGPGSHCAGVCDRGYRGSVSAYCEPRGHWVYRGACRWGRPPRCGAPSMPHVDLMSCRGLGAPGDVCRPTCRKGYVGYPTATCGADGVWTYGGSCTSGPRGSLTANNSQCGLVTERHCGSAAPCCSAGGTCGSDAAACGAGCEAAYSWGATCDLVTCGPPLGRLHWDTGRCEPVAGGACDVTCEVGFVGTPTAVCGVDGSWTYGGSCQRLCAPGYSYADGSVGGNASTGVGRCSDCAAQCSDQPTCRAYECGPGGSSCYLYPRAPQQSVPHTAAVGRVLCTRDAAHGCAAGYYWRTGRIPGDGKKGGPHGCVKCAELCSLEPDCASYECDPHPAPGNSHCDLNTESEPTEANSGGRVFCTKRGSAWLQVEDENAWYILLPGGNSVTQHQLGPAQSTTTTWTRLQIRGLITRGMAEIYVALGESAAHAMDGHAMDGHAPRFGTARECRPWSGGRPPISSYDVRLGGTPFALGRLPPSEPFGAVSVGRSACWDAGRACAGYCGGGCGVCGLGQWGMDAAFPLAVVDRAAFDAAFLPLSDANAGCWTLQSEAACLGSRDGRAGQSFFRQPCEWCCGQACTPGGHMCEPRDWLLEQPSYSGRSRSSLGSNTCPVDCGEPRLNHGNFTGCEHTFGGTCRPRCQSGFTGRLTAVCGRNGLWQYSGFCTTCTDGFWKDALGYSCASYTANNWCDASGRHGRGWRPEWGTFANYAVGALSASDVCCGCGAGLDTCQRLTQVAIGSSTAPSKVVAVTESVVTCPAICGLGCYSGAPDAGAGDTFVVTVDSGRVAVDRVDVTAPWSVELSIPCCVPCATGFHDRIGSIGGTDDVHGKGAGVAVGSCGDCAALCLEKEQCWSYECSDAQLQCYLSMEPSPTAGPREGYHFCSRRECGVPTLADAMDVSDCAPHYGGVCDVSCKSGYTGSPTAECGPEGMWHYEGACTPISCGKPQLPHVDFRDCPHTFGGTCSPTCQGLYSGNVTAVCGADGAWRYGGSCNRVSCGPPSQPNVDFTNCAFEWGDMCRPVCVAGYVGSPSAECEQDGHWKYGGSCQVPIPTYSKGAVYPIPPEGRARSIIEGEALSFELLAVRVKVASVPLASLTLSLEAPDGTHIDLLRDLEGCTGTELDVTFDWTAEPLPAVECHTANRGVRARPTVLGRLPDLPPRQQPAGYWVLSVASSHEFFSGELLLWSLTVWERLQPCAPGFEGLVGGGHGSGPLRGERSHSPRSRPPHGYSDRTGSGRDAHNESTSNGDPIDVFDCGDCAALCLEKEQCWSYECSDAQLQCYLSMEPSPTAGPREGYHFCSLRECGVPTLADAMDVSDCAPHYGGVCDVSCGSGYTGSPTAECGPEGMWHYEGACTPISCGKPQLPHVDFRDCPHTFGGTCSPTCQGLYSGNVTAVCGADGAWRYGGSCNRVSCGPPSQPNVDFTNCAFEWGDMCRPVCVAGYVGSPSAECEQDGHWKYGGSCQVPIPTYSKGVVYPIPPEGRARSIIEGEALSFELLAVRVKVASVPLASLTLSLEAPDGTHIDLLRDLEGCTGTELDVVFDSTASTVLNRHNCHNANQQLIVRPNGAAMLSAIKPPQPAGYWILTTVTSNPRFGGLLQLWSLTATTRQPSGLEAYVLGQGTSAQLGLAHSVSLNAPIALEPPNAQQIAGLATGEGHTLLLAAGDLYVFGRNDYGQLGLGPGTGKQDAPALLPSPTGQPVTAIACGRDHSAFISAGALWLFGRNDDGQLGLGDNATRFAPERLAAPNGRAVDAVALGHTHSAFVAGGEVWVFGRNEFGQLGLADNAPRFVPARLASPNGLPVAAVALGDTHSAIVAGGRLYVFGGNAHGQLVLGDRKSRFTPQLLSTPNGGEMEAIALGGAHSAFVAGGELHVFGRNDRGQLGLRRRGPSDVRSVPIALRTPGGAAVTAVALGGMHSAVLAGGYLYTCGSNQHGQLGLGDYMDRDTLQLLESPGGKKISDVTLGQAHTMFLSDPDRSTFTPSPTSSSTPVPTSTPTATRSPTPSVSPTPTSTTTATTTPSPTASYSTSRTATPSPTTTVSPTRTPTTTPTVSITPTCSGSPTPTLSPSLTCSPSGSLTATPTTTPNPTPSDTRSRTASPTATASPTCTRTSSPTTSRTFSRTISSSATSSPTATASTTASRSTTPTLTPATTLSPSVTITSSPTRSVTATGTRSCTPSLTTTLTATYTSDATLSTTPTGSPTATCTCTATYSPTLSTSATPTRTIMSTPTVTPSRTATPSSGLTFSTTATCTPTSTSSPTLSVTTTQTHTITAAATESNTLSLTATPTAAPSHTSTVSTTQIPSPTTTASSSGTSMSTVTTTPTPSFSATPSPTQSSTDTSSSTSSSSPSGTPTISGVFTLTPTTPATISQSSTATPTSSRLFTPSPTPSTSTLATPTDSPTSSRLFTLTPPPSTSPSLTPTSTPTQSRLFTPTPTASITTSRTLTTTPTPTLTCTPSQTISHSPSGTPTPSHQCTPTSTSSNTLSPTTTTTPTPSRLFTPTPSASITTSWTPTTTPTPSRLFTPSGTPSHTLSHTPSGTPTPSRLFTLSGTPSHTLSHTPSGTPTPSRLFTLSGTPSHTLSHTPSGTPTPSRLFTLSGTPSHTLSHTPSGTPTSSRLFTLSGTPSHTLSRTTTTTPTPSRLFTPTCTSSGTISASTSASLTPSRQYTPTSTASGTSSQTPTGTLTPSRLFTPTATPSPTASPAMSTTPTSSHLFTPSASPTRTLTRSLSSTLTPRGTPTASLTQSLATTATATASLSPTLLPTATPSPTATAEVPQCDAGAPLAQGANGALTLQVAPRGGKCLRKAGLGRGSSHMTTRKVIVRILTFLEGTATLRLDSGCPAQDSGCPACDACQRQYTPADVGLEHVLDLGSAPDVQLLLLYEPPTAANRRQPSAAAETLRDATASAFSAEIVVYHTASSLLVVLLALSTLLAIPFCMGLGRWHAKRIAARPLAMESWEKGRPGQLLSLRLVHPRWQNPWIQVALLLGAYLVVVGAAWFAVLNVIRHPDAPVSVGMLAGLAVAGAGLLLLLVFGVRALRDDAALSCPACATAVSQWYFCGVHLPPVPEAPHQRHKGHTACMRCVECRHPVITGGWEDSPCDRLYHATCWFAHCTRACADVRYAQAWGARAEVTDLERAYVLVASFAEPSAEPTMEALLRQWPHLYACPLPRLLTPRHCAARAGNVQALAAMLENAESCLDTALQAEAAAHSLRITGLAAEQNDLYVHQAPLLFNGQPVYVGQATGQYTYYYEPQPDDPGTWRDPGWCVSDYLGNGNTDVRLRLPTPTSEEQGVLEPETGLGKRRRRQGSLLGLLPPSITKKKNKSSGQSTASDEAAVASSGSGAASNSLRSGSAKNVLLKQLKQSLGLRTADSAALAEDDAGLSVSAPSAVPSAEPSSPSDKSGPKTKCLGPDDLGLLIVPRAVSLLEAAVASGQSPMVCYALGAYEARYPQCLLWQHHVGHGLWWAYPPHVQTQIAKALAKGQRGITIRDGPTTAWLDFEALVQQMASATQGIRCRLQTVLQYRSGEEWFATSSAAAVMAWEEAFVLVASGALAASAPNRHTLVMLYERGAVDAALWGPACAGGEQRRTLGVGGTQREWFVDVMDMLFAAESELNVADHSPFCSTARREGDLWDAETRSGARDSLFLDRGLGGRYAPRGHGDRGEGSRFSDGLTAPTSRSAQSTFYATGYSTDMGTLQFCFALNDNALGLVFDQSSLVQMSADCVMKVHELGRQWVRLSPVHIVPIYVYTYELSGEGEQIYGAMNRAMRTNDEAGIAFWRPLIWQVDRALLMLPPYRGKLYRGINLKFNEQSYKRAEAVCWPAFSSASATRAVAEEFVKGDDGTLFFLQSVGARAISRFSKFPLEDEVLFRPNTVFEITSTLYGDSDIGAFYASVDNIAMTEVHASSLAVSKPKHVPAGDAFSGQLFSDLPGISLPWTADAAAIVVHLPECLFTTFLTLLANAPQGRPLLVDTAVDAEGRYIGQVVIERNPACPPLELPDVCRVWHDRDRGGTEDDPPNSPSPADATPTSESLRFRSVASSLTLIPPAECSAGSLPDPEDGLHCTSSPPDSMQCTPTSQPNPALDSPTCKLTETLPSIAIWEPASMPHTPTSESDSVPHAPTFIPALKPCTPPSKADSPAPCTPTSEPESGYLHFYVHLPPEHQV